MLVQKRNISIYYLLIIFVLFISCATNKNIGIENDIDEFYQNPAIGLKSYNKAILSEENKFEIRRKIGDYKNNDELLQKICIYLKGEYRSDTIIDGPNMRYVNEIINTKTLRHCAEYGVIWLSILRLYQIPCVYIQAMKIEDAEDFNGISWGGHVFIIAYINNEFVLIDSTREKKYVYNINSKIIPIVINGFANKGFMEMFRCFDPGSIIMREKDYKKYIVETRANYNKNMQPKVFLGGINMIKNDSVLDFKYRF